MDCDQCGERPAVVNLNHQVAGQWVLVHLCERCAAQKGLATEAAITKTPLGSFIAAMNKGQVPVREGEETGEACRTCGATLQDFREASRLGCPDCWSVFEPSLRELVRRLHGSTHHVGEQYVPRGAAPPGPAAAPTAADLRERLRVAVEAENFELAAELRDRLRGIEA